MPFKEIFKPFIQLTMREYQLINYVSVTYSDSLFKRQQQLAYVMYVM